MQQTRRFQHVFAMHINSPHLLRRRAHRFLAFNQAIRCTATQIVHVLTPAGPQDIPSLSLPL